MKLIFLDTETTGLEEGKDRLCQVCYQSNTVVKKGYFKPPLPISVKAMSVTHITNKMVQDRESFVGSEIHGDLQGLLKEGVLVAHNAKFDIAMLEAEGLTVPKFICTLRVARFLDTNNVIPEYGLQFLRYFLEIDVDGNPHDAETDVKVLSAIFERLLGKMKASYGDETQAIEKMVEISKVPTIFTYFNFGKYKGQSIEAIVESDRPYLDWLLKTKMQDDKSDEDWIYTLNHYLHKS